MEFSNKTLAWLVVATIVVSMAGTLISLNNINSGWTGYATSANTTGNVTVSISSQTSLQFIVANLSLGTGFVDPASVTLNCTYVIDNWSRSANVVNRSADCDSFNNVTTPLTIENTGNLVLNVSINFSANASTFIGGGAGANPIPVFMWKVQQNESANSCGVINTTYNDTWQNVTGNMTPICNGLSWTNNNDSISIGILLGIPEDAAGSKTVIINAVGINS